MDPAFRLNAFSTRWRAWFWFEKWFLLVKRMTWSRHLFLFYFGKGKQNKKKKTLKIPNQWCQMGAGRPLVGRISNAPKDTKSIWLPRFWFWRFEWPKINNIQSRVHLVIIYSFNTSISLINYLFQKAKLYKINHGWNYF